MDEFGPNFFGPGQNWAMKIKAGPSNGPRLMLVFGTGGRPKLEHFLKNIPFSLVFQLKMRYFATFRLNSKQFDLFE